jgi:hypothetical protein
MLAKEPQGSHYGCTMTILPVWPLAGVTSDESERSLFARRSSD